MVNSETRIREIGRHLFDRIKGEKPSIFQKNWWTGKVLNWSMKNPTFKVQMFRFVDVLPSLTTLEDTARHVREYLCLPGLPFPGILRFWLTRSSPRSLVSKMTAAAIKRNVLTLAYRFIAGANPPKALPVLLKLRKQKISFTVDLLGEATMSESEAQGYQKNCVDVLNTLHEAVSQWPYDPHLDEQASGRRPRVNISVKVSALYSQLDCLAMEESIAMAKQRLLPIMRRAKELSAFVNLDMEQYAYKDLTLALFKSLMDEKEFSDFHHAGIVIQAYLKDSEADLLHLIEWAKLLNRSITVRLVKGAYWDYETIQAEQEGWDNPVFEKKQQTDANYEKLTRILFDHYPYVKTAIGSHNVRSLATAIAMAQERGIPNNGWEIQMLFGMAEPIKGALAKEGYFLRDYVPIGELIPGMAYLVRRLLENTSNESFLRQSFNEKLPIAHLLKNPTEEL